ncbi:chemotaxis protein CheX [Xylophilus rhododendri]|uniref:Chemotaxis protein CheX n=1 Tax=Xylophilus rhododendri TaxID=2697032 RepID=A0A857J322_9BURK|nr:chemotaxis protein CheX [Xylophilus rhododendri]QHI97442.1 chemotaxis protein CheX [Xylophilus rhododendri]
MSSDTPNTLTSKVLVLEPSPAHREAIGAFCQLNQLQAHKVLAENILSVLASNIDLGAIFLPEKMGEDAHAGRTLGQRIHALRPELPLFLRTESQASADEMPAGERACFAALYTLETLHTLVPAVQQSIFTLAYPGALVRGIAEIARNAFASQFKGMRLEIDPPYIVRDRLIFGEVFSLIPIESDWCRGFMTLQTEEAALERLVRTDRTYLAAADADDFRGLNGLLGELTNLIWGAFKNRYEQQQALQAARSQVPIVINHLHRYISFGSTDPQLCLRCTLHAPDDAAFAPVVVYLRFVFSLNWSPDAFRENDLTAESLVACGDLELF